MQLLICTCSRFKCYSAIEHAEESRLQTSATSANHFQFQASCSESHSAGNRERSDASVTALNSGRLIRPLYFALSASMQLHVQCLQCGPFQLMMLMKSRDRQESHKHKHIQVSNHAHFSFSLCLFLCISLYVLATCSWQAASTKDITSHSSCNRPKLATFLTLQVGTGRSYASTFNSEQCNLGRKYGLQKTSHHIVELLQDNVHPCA